MESNKGSESLNQLDFIDQIKEFIETTVIDLQREKEIAKILDESKKRDSSGESGRSKKKK